MDIRNILDIPCLYLLWQRPFILQKIAPFLKKRENQLGRLLDLGCGPGTSRKLIPVFDYTGLDLNAKYINDAKNKLSGEFVVGDASNFALGMKFDTILCNSLSHHLSDQQLSEMLCCCQKHLPPEGELHLVDIVMPPHKGIARYLAKKDRGQFVRSHEEILNTISSQFRPYFVDRYFLHLGGINLWHMTYVAAKRK